MRALLDANIFISYLLATTESGPIQSIIRSAISGEFTLLLPEALLDEFVSRIPGKPYLAERITAAELSAFASILREIGEEVTEIVQKIPAVTRHPKDDYLLAYAVVGGADYLVTGDDDLLVLNRVAGVQIVRPAEFAALLERGQV